MEYCEGVQGLVRIMEIIFSIVINGLLSGGIFAILAVGFSLVFGVAKILNLAHSAFYMVSAFIIFIITQILGLPLFLSTLIAILITGIMGMFCYHLLFDRIKERETAVMIISIALAILFQEIFLLIFGGHPQRVPPFVSGFVEIFDVRVSYQQVIAIGTAALVLLAIRLFLLMTKLGIAVRAVAQDREIANVAGIDVNRIFMITMGLSAALAGVAGSVVGNIYMVNPFMWVQPLVIILAAVVLGGMGSIKGSAIAALILGFTETLVTFLAPGGSFLKGAVSLSIMVIVLLIRPEGLFGVVFEEERL